MFVSMMFPVFLGMVATLFFLLPKKRRPMLLLLASYACCGWLDSQSLAVLVVFSFCIWAVGIQVENAVRTGQKKVAKTYAMAAVAPAFCCCPNACRAVWQCRLVCLSICSKGSDT